MEFYRCCLFVTFVVLTVDQFVGRDDGPLQQQKIEHNMLCAFVHRVAMCCNMLGVVGSSLKMVKFELTTPNTSEHLATGWPNAGNMLRPTMLR